MKNLQKFKTSKLFYNKWPYKLVVRNCSAIMLKHLGADHVINYCNNNNFFPTWWNKDSALRFATVIKSYLDKDIQLRADSNNLSIFCKNEILFYTLEIALSEWSIESYQPANKEELDFLTHKS